MDGLTIDNAGLKTLADLRIQAMMFDMDVDLETASLVSKSQHKDAVWLTRWKEKREQSDFNEYFDVDRSDDGRN